jgi:hypothetical protein
MPTDEQLAQIDAMLEGVERNIRAAFLSFLSELRDEQVFALIDEYVRGGDIEAALGVVEQYVNRLGVNISGSIASVGTQTALELGRIIPATAAAVYFDPSHPRAAALIRANSLTFVRQFSEEQRRATREAIAQAYDTGQGTAATARAFRDSIGLTTQQEQAIANYRRLLQRGSAEALNRQLRDRRFDASVRAASEGRRALEPEQIDRMVSRYRARFLAHRADMIARTEGLRATSLAREEAVRQMIEQTGIDERRVRRRWNSTRDKRTREAHRAMDGQIRGVEEVFIDGDGNALLYPGDPTAPPGTTINCRCSVTAEIVANPS